LVAFKITASIPHLLIQETVCAMVMVYDAPGEYPFAGILVVMLMLFQFVPLVINEPEWQLVQFPLSPGALQ
jgi:hypothetical protein